jgi:hypothetical protein
MLLFKWHYLVCVVFFSTFFNTCLGTHQNIVHLLSVINASLPCSGATITYFCYVFYFCTVEYQSQQVCKATRPLEHNMLRYDIRMYVKGLTRTQTSVICNSAWSSFQWRILP